ncbi:MAG: DUF2298 domain-containing protein [Dehalococcoidia bacterium]
MQEPGEHHPEAAREQPGGRAGRGFTLALAVLLALALALRLFGLDWDDGGLFHPDERAILMRVVDLEVPDSSELGDLLDAERSPLNPGWFNYGSLPLYLLKGVQVASSPFIDFDIFDLRIPGRVISALADTATVALVYFLGRNWYGRRVGLLAAALTTLAVLHIQLAHFFAVDGILTLFIVGAVFFSARVAYTGRVSDSLLAGLMVGFGLATKASIAPIVLAVIAGHAVYAFSLPGEALDIRGAFSGDGARRQWRAYKGLLLAGVTALVALLVTQPYMVLDWETFFANVGEQSEMVRRIVDYPYTRQYIDTPKYWYQAWQLGAWGLGPVLGAAAWLGFGASLVAVWFTRRKVDLVILAWVLPYLLLTGWFDVKFMRYMLPLTPFLILYAARLLWWLGGVARAFFPGWRYVAVVPAAIVLVATAHYALSFSLMYTEQHPGQAVSDWLRQNAEPGSAVLQEHWEEGVPHVPGLQYPERLEIYNSDSVAKFERITEAMAGGDYFVLFSNRLYGTVARLPDRYPVSTEFYRALFDGSLGYELVYNPQRPIASPGFVYYDDPFARVPFGPPENFERPQGAIATLDMGWADESFTVYDHPQSMVFANADRLSAAELMDVVGLGGSVWPDTEAEVGLLLTDEEKATQRAGGTWTDLAFLRGIPDGLSWIVWLLGAQVFALAALPLSFMVFRSLPDRGYLLSKSLGLILVASVAWLLASLGWVGFGFVGVLAGLLSVAVLSGLAWWKYREEMIGFFRTRLKFVLFCEALFVAAFLAFMLIRMANPDLWHPYRGGEKPMDFAYLNAVARSTLMPPYDPWFAGGYLNYYYFGQFIVATLIRFTGIIPQVAYNLSIPLLFALTVGGVFSIVYNLAELTRRARGALSHSSRSPIYAGLAAIFLVAVAGNIDGMVQVAEGTWRTLVRDLPFGTFDYWRSSRMMEPGSLGFEITEFPFFTFLFADLHAHLIAIPFAVLALGIGLAVFARTGLRRPVIESWSALVILGLVIGALRIINTWDFPTQLGLAGLFIVGGELFSTRHAPMRGLMAGVIKWIFVAAVGYLFFLPFHQHFELFNNGVQASQTQTPLWRYMAIHAIFLLILPGWIVYQWRHSLTVRQRIEGWLNNAGMPAWAVSLGLVGLVALVAAFMFTQWATAVFALALAAVVGGAALLAVAGRTSGARYIVAAAAMVVMALGIGAAVDVITVKGDIGRMNTVFKFYLQAWWLLGLASAYFMWLMASSGWFSPGRLTITRAAWMAVLALLALGMMVYPVLGTKARVDDRFVTSGLGLDGMDFMDEATYSEPMGTLHLGNDRDAIEWLQRNVEGSPVIVEGLTDMYRWGNRVSVYTGLPAVVGWDWHQRQQRVDYAWAVTQRRSQVEQFYNTQDVTQAIKFLDRYEVRYVYVGDLERLYYSEEGLAKFDQMEDRGLRPAYEDDAVTIYEYSPGG